MFLSNDTLSTFNESSFFFFNHTHSTVSALSINDESAPLMRSDKAVANRMTGCFKGLAIEVRQPLKTPLHTYGIISVTILGPNCS